MSADAADRVAARAPEPELVAPGSTTHRTRSGPAARRTSAPGRDHDERRSSRRLRTALFAISALTGALLFVGLTSGGHTARPSPLPLVPGGWSNADALLVLAGFGLDQVSVAGHRFTPDGAILDALGLADARTWRTFDADAARDRIEQLPWVATASLTWRYPGRLDVRVTERTAFGIWRRGTRETLIDATGRSLSDIRPDSISSIRSTLRLFEGEGADSEAAALTATVERHPEIAARLVSAERVAGRRWTLHLDNGTSLVLPPDREAQVLESLLSSQRLKRLAAEPGRVVDLRGHGRVAVRAAAFATRSGAPKLADGGP